MTLEDQKIEAVYTALATLFRVAWRAYHDQDRIVTNHRTWVSGKGTDSGGCPVTAPCKTFAFALTQTAAGGEIDVLDPGGYGAVTITKSTSIVNDGVGSRPSGLPRAMPSRSMPARATAFTCAA